ncbi:STAS domain-containing protein [Nonomuraea sp. B10E15]|uniref:STAS domain-containing protein n=1 Tax=Nonomuraea sp. B10E15 TaxID=3153560 RepID=UPI00325C41B7
MLGHRHRGRRHDVEPHPVPAASDPAARALYDDDVLHITRVRTPDTSLIRLDGQIDASNSEAVRSTLTQTRHQHAHVVIDVGRVTFADVTGTRSLADVTRGSRSAQLRRIPRQVKRVPDLLELACKQRPPPQAHVLNVRPASISALAHHSSH